ncbi:MAG TPA: phosphatase PAP2 family protein [Arenibaculum sp.]|nr:phosphatase PAP2 family protein [Arenibaculum sp.]
MINRVEELGRRLLPTVSRVGRREIAMLAVMALGAACLWFFVALAEEVVEGDTHRIDRALLLMLRNPEDLSDPIGPGWMEEFGRDLTALGGVGLLTMMTLAVAGYLWLARKRHAMVLVLVSVGGGLLLSTLLKQVFDRTRPDLVPHGSIVYTASFPSGHSMMAAVTYLTLGALLARVEERRRVKIYLITLAITVTVLVGVSRVYLGVHWPSDVLAGWTAGATWAALCWLAAVLLQRRGTVEKEGQTQRE